MDAPFGTASFWLYLGIVQLSVCFIIVIVSFGKGIHFYDFK